MNTTYRRLRKEQGFTLVELLIVVIILGVLSGIVVFAVGNFTDHGEASACSSDVKSVEVAQEAYAAQHKGDYADNVGELVTAGYLKSTPSGVTTGDSGVVTKNC